MTPSDELDQLAKARRRNPLPAGESLRRAIAAAGSTAKPPKIKRKKLGSHHGPTLAKMRRRAGRKGAKAANPGEGVKAAWERVNEVGIGDAVTIETARRGRRRRPTALGKARQLGPVGEE